VIRSYLICSTPRTGSSLLCGLLDSTGVAGHPESWFRQQGEGEWATAHLTPLDPDQAGSAAGLLSVAFGPTRFVYPWRGDVVAQAVSLLRAEQTGVWTETAQERQEPEAAPRFDFGEVRDLVRQIEEHNSAWENWFAAGGIRPYLVRYEQREITVRHKRLADELNAQWVEEYRRQGRGAGCRAAANTCR
jgi:LPS sulfotransferase NodH